MKHTIFFRAPLVLLLTVMGLFSSAQHAEVAPYAVPMDTIRDVITRNPNLIDSLNKRLLVVDEGIAQEHYFIIYYGSTLLESYSPYGERMNGLNELFEVADWASITTAASEALLLHPGYSEPLRILGIAHHEQGDTSAANAYFERYYNMLLVPFYSGTGKTTDSAFVVRSVNDEYALLREMGFLVDGQALIHEGSFPFDRMTCHTENDSTQLDFFFNIALPFQSLNSTLGFSKVEDILPDSGGSKKWWQFWRKKN